MTRRRPLAIHFTPTMKPVPFLAPCVALLLTASALHAQEGNPPAVQKIAFSNGSPDEELLKALSLTKAAESLDRTALAWVQKQQCGSCHTLADAQTKGEVGPDLDKVLAGKKADFIHESIVNPNAEIAAGYKPDVMPGNFADVLTDQQLQSLVDYLQKTAGKS